MGRPDDAKRCEERPCGRRVVEPGAGTVADLEGDEERCREGEHGQDEAQFGVSCPHVMDLEDMNSAC